MFYFFISLRVKIAYIKATRYNLETRAYLGGVHNRVRHVMTERIVRPAEAERLSGYCNVQLMRLEAKGEFPPRFKLAEDSGLYGAVGWRLSDIEKWIEKRAATARRPAAA